MTNQQAPNPFQPMVQTENEIELLPLFKKLWRDRKKIRSTTLFFILIGFFVALTSPKYFTANSAFIPQTAESGKSGGGLSSLASLAGINLGSISAGSEIPPSLYPKLVSSVPFKKALLDSKVTVSESGDKVTYRQYFTEIYSPDFLSIIKDYTLGLPGRILKLIRGENKYLGKAESEGIIRISREEFKLFKLLESQLSVIPNAKEGFVSISFVMPDPVMAAEMVKAAEALLQKEVINYKIQNAKEQLRFTEAQFKEKKEEFEKIQSRLANFRDRNQNIVSASVNNELLRLESEYNFSFSIYTELAKQLEQAKLQVSKDTPIFSVIQPVSVPIDKSAPNRPFILVVFTLFGIIVGIGLVFSSEFLKGFKTRWINTEL